MGALVEMFELTGLPARRWHAITINHDILSRPHEAWLNVVVEEQSGCVLFLG